MRSAWRWFCDNAWVNIFTILCLGYVAAIWFLPGYEGAKVHHMATWVLPVLAWLALAISVIAICDPGYEEMKRRHYALARNLGEMQVDLLARIAGLASGLGLSAIITALAMGEQWAAVVYVGLICLIPILVGTGLIIVKAFGLHEYLANYSERKKVGSEKEPRPVDSASNLTGWLIQNHPKVRPPVCLQHLSISNPVKDEDLRRWTPGENSPIGCRANLGTLWGRASQATGQYGPMTDLGHAFGLQANPELIPLEWRGYDLACGGTTLTNKYGQCILPVLTWRHEGGWHLYLELTDMRAEVSTRFLHLGLGHDAETDAAEDIGEEERVAIEARRSGRTEAEVTAAEAEIDDYCRRRGIPTPPRL
jgi:hypothetical protein